MPRLTLRERFALPLHDAIGAAAGFAMLFVAVGLWSLS